MTAYPIGPQTSEHVLAELLELVLSNRLVMPGVPEVAMRIRQAIQQEELASIGQIAALIAEDPVLMAYIIKISNSVGMRGGREIRHIRDAIVRLGLKLTAAATTSFCIMQMMAVAPEDWYRTTPSGRPDYADLLIAANLDVHRGSEHPMAVLEERPPSALRRLGLLPRVPLAEQLQPRRETAGARLLASLAA